MEDEGGLWGGFRASRLPPLLLGFALLLSLLALNVGWFSVDTRLQTWTYDADNAAQGGGGKGVYQPDKSGRIDTEMKLFSLDTRITPKNAQDLIEERARLPTYEDDAPRTGTQMRGVFLFQVLNVLALGSTAGVYAWHRRGRRDLSRSLWKFAALLGAFTLGTLAYVAVAVPPAAQEDTHAILVQYTIYLREFGVPVLPEKMIEPVITFRIPSYTSICCNPPAHFPVNNQEYLVQVTTVSNASAGFWLQTLSLPLALGGLWLARRAGYVGGIRGSRPAEPATPAPPRAT